MLQRLKYALAASFALTAATACDDDDDAPATEFEATLTGAAERPTPVTTNASGTATVTINDANSTITYEITVADLANASAAHIHIGGANVVGDPAASLLAAPVDGITNGVLATGTIDVGDLLGGVTFATLAAKIRSGEAYINVHTTANPDGEIRGQLVVQD